MPLWNIVHSPKAFPGNEKQLLAGKITELYTSSGLPAFYVCVLYNELKPESFFNSGKQTDNFVRIVIDHVARRLISPAQQKGFLEAVEAVIAPFIRDKGFNWELQIDETPIELWRVQGLVPPPDRSPAFERWVKENRPSEYQQHETESSKA